jgi:hypothetical protein
VFSAHDKKIGHVLVKSVERQVAFFDVWCAQLFTV